MKITSLKFIIPALLAAILLPFLLVYLSTAYVTALPEIRVPNLVGLPLEAAQERLRSEKLRGNFAGTVFDAEYPQGVVARQKPEAGRLVKAGRTITLLISSGLRKVSVPNLLGRPLSQVETVLAAQGLMLGEIKEEVVKEMSPGLVLTQDPFPDDEVDAETRVNITVSASQEAPLTEDNGEVKKGGFFLW